MMYFHCLVWRIIITNNHIMASYTFPLPSGLLSIKWILVNQKTKTRTLSGVRIECLVAAISEKRSNGAVDLLLRDLYRAVMPLFHRSRNELLSILVICYLFAEHLGDALQRFGEARQQLHPIAIPPNAGNRQDRVNFFFSFPIRSDAISPPFDPPLILQKAKTGSHLMIPTAWK